MGSPAGNRARRVENTSHPPWASWIGSRAGIAIQFIETYCRSPKGIGWGQPLKLLTWEKDWIEQALAPETEAAALSVGRGNGKSTIAAGLACWGGFYIGDLGAPVVPIIAVTVGQAMRSVYDTAVSMVKHEPELDDRSLIYTGFGSSRISIPSTEGTIFPVSAEPDSLQGLDIYPLAICDEIGFISPESWAALLMARKREGAVVYGTGTPGLDKENALFAIRTLALNGVLPKEFKFREYASKPGTRADDESSWPDANPSMLEGGFPTLQGLRTDLAASPVALFDIFHRGLWVEGTQSWLGENAYQIWEASIDRYDLVKDATTWVGIDVGLKHDSTAVVALQRKPDGKYHARLRLWVPVTDEPVDMADVMQYLRELCSTYKVAAISFDNRFMDVPAATLFEEGLPMVEVPQSVERMTPICGDLYVKVLAKLITHEDDPAFRQHILNAVPRLNARGFTLAKAKSKGRIDATIALALALDRAEHVKLKKKAVVL
jgi:phage terminase large subunit-like protein